MAAISSTYLAQFRPAFTIPNPQTILNYVQTIAMAAKTVCHAIDRAHSFIYT